MAITFICSSCEEELEVWTEEGNKVVVRLCERCAKSEGELAVMRKIAFDEGFRAGATAEPHIRTIFNRADEAIRKGGVEGGNN